MTLFYPHFKSPVLILRQYFLFPKILLELLYISSFLLPKFKTQVEKHFEPLEFCFHFTTFKPSPKNHPLPQLIYSSSIEHFLGTKFHSKVSLQYLDLRH